MELLVFTFWQMEVLFLHYLFLGLVIPTLVVFLFYLIQMVRRKVQIVWGMMFLYTSLMNILQIPYVILMLIIPKISMVVILMQEEIKIQYMVQDHTGIYYISRQVIGSNLIPNNYKQKENKFVLSSFYNCHYCSIWFYACLSLRTLFIISSNSFSSMVSFSSNSLEITSSISLFWVSNCFASS